MMHRCTSVVRRCIDFVLPPFCSYCRVYLSEQSVLCDECSARIRPLASVPIQVTTTCTVSVIAASAYEDPMRPLVVAKHRGDRTASVQLAQLIARHTPLLELPCDYMVPIPLHWTRRMYRGYNQAAVMAGVLARYRGVECRELLSRVRWTKFQSALSIDERDENVKDSLRLVGVRGDEYKGKHLVLVDDVMTTGATLKEAARQLYTLKPASITALVACRVV